ncbi:MAG: FIST C-terminal domain-containing protein [bacterium]|nr:FIST C-terminal domain-containing protein [bacterium]
MQEAKSIKVHTAQTLESDPRAAVAELAQALSCPNMAAVVFFCSIDYDLKELAAALCETFTCPLVGCTTAGEIGPAGYRDHSITAFSIESKLLRVYPNFIPNVEECESQTIEALASDVATEIGDARVELPGAMPFGFLLIDGLTAKEEQVIGQLYHALGNVPIVGGSAAGGDSFKSTYVYYKGEFHTKAATFSVFATTLPFEIFRTQHFIPSNTKLVITQARPEERLVLEINGKPAAQEYARCLGLDKNNLTSEIFAMHPVMLKLGGEYYVRSVMQMLDDGTLKFACAIDEGLVLTIAEGVDMVENLRDSLEALQRRMHPQVIIGCECFFRKIEVLEKDIKESMGRIMKHHNVIGFHTYGEQINSVHVNQTFTGVAIGGE